MRGLGPTYWCAIGAGSGKLPAPGTAGSLVAYVLAWLAVSQWGWGWWYVAVLVLAAILGVWVCAKAERMLGGEDPSEVVWDEFVGSWIGCLWLPLDWRWWVLSFVVFRVLDISKPMIIGWLDRNVHGGLGIMLDDVAAGVITLGIVQLIVFLI